jgi:hypothetical protein
MQDLARILSHPSLSSPPLARRVPVPKRPHNPTSQPLGCPLSLSPCPCSGRPRDSPPRAPPLLSASPTKQARAVASLHLACFPGETPPSPVHHHRQATPNPLRTCRSRHSPDFYPTLTSHHSRTCTRAPHHPSTPLAQTLPLSHPLQCRPCGRTPARRYDWTTCASVTAPLDTRVLPRNRLPRTPGCCTATPPPTPANARPEHHDHPCQP